MWWCIRCKTFPDERINLQTNICRNKLFLLILCYCALLYESENFRGHCKHIISIVDHLCNAWINHVHDLYQSVAILHGLYQSVFILFWLYQWVIWTGVRCCFWLNLSSHLTLHKSCLNFWLKSEIRLKSETAPHPCCAQFISSNDSCTHSMSTAYYSFYQKVAIANCVPVTVVHNVNYSMTIANWVYQPISIVYNSESRLVITHCLYQSVSNVHCLYRHNWRLPAYDLTSKQHIVSTCIWMVRNNLIIRLQKSHRRFCWFEIRWLIYFAWSQLGINIYHVGLPGS